jgi:hypothetical protein
VLPKKKKKHQKKNQTPNQEAATAMVKEYKDGRDALT